MIFTSQYNKIGDLIYLIPVIDYMTDDEPATILLRMDQDAYSSIAPLLAALPYVERVEVWTDQTGVSLDSWRPQMLHPNLAAHMCLHYSVPLEMLKQKWIEFDDDEKTEFPTYENYCLINRTFRYRNNKADWISIIDRFNSWSNLTPVFAGTKDEYDDFTANVLRKTDYCQFIPDINNMLIAAQFLSTCGQFIGNQSAFLALAHAVQCPVQVETSILQPNCVFIRPYAHYMGISDEYVLEVGLNQIE